MRRFPERLLRLIRTSSHRETEHAFSEMERLGLDETDVSSVAETAEWWQRNKDGRRPGESLYEMIGRDTSGWRLYTAGKETIYDGETVWLIITIHEAD